MGNKQTKEEDAFDEQIATVIKKRALEHKRQATSFQKLLLRFNRLQRGFDRCREVFHELDLDGNKVIDLSELRQGCQKLGILLDDSMVVSIFGAADMDHNRVVDPREFIVVLALINMFNSEVNKNSTALHPDIAETFALAEEAFLFFDASKDGIMQKDEVLAALQEESAPKAKHRNSMQPMTSPVYKRFAEMDWDKNGNISFKEWLYAIQSWVLDED